MILAIDPGLRHLGYAVFTGTGSLQEAGLAFGAPSAERGAPAWQSIAKELQSLLPPCSTWDVVCEWPQVYKNPGKAVDNDDLLQLCGVIGNLTARVPGTWSLVRPLEWKGQRSKQATTAQMFSVLTLDESTRLGAQLAAVPGSLKHNVYDAIAIGLVHLHRMR